MQKKDICGRVIPEWPGKMMYHTTDEESAKDILEKGYKVLTEEAGGNYGFAISFTDDLCYSRNFGKFTTVAILANSIKILNITLEEDGEIFSRIMSGKVRMEDYGPSVLAAGYDGIYDPGAGDLFIYNEKKVKYLGTAHWDGKRETREILDMSNSRLAA